MTQRSPSPGSTPGPSASRSAPRAPSPWRPTARRVVFLRSAPAPTGRNLLWVLDLGEPARSASRPTRARCSAAPRRPAAEERARRERSREGSAGIVGYATDGAVELAAFALSGRLFTAELRGRHGPRARRPGPGDRPAPLARRTPRRLRRRAARCASWTPTAAATGRWPSPSRTTVHLRAGRVHRGRGDGPVTAASGGRRTATALLVARVDDAPVQRWWIADPANPDRSPAEVAYPAAGTANAEVTLSCSAWTARAPRSTGTGSATRTWRRCTGRRRARRCCSSRRATSASQLYPGGGPGDRRDPHRAPDDDPIWLDLFPGVPGLEPGGQLVRIADEGGARVAGRRRTAADRARVARPRGARRRLRDDVLVSASAGAAADGTETGEVHVYRVERAGPERVSRRARRALGGARRAA